MTFDGKADHSRLYKQERKALREHELTPEHNWEPLQN